MSRKELRFQNHIIDTYKAEGGTGKKWASEWAVGNPDLVLSCHGAGVHLAEVKHRPTFDPKRSIQNPMSAKQISAAKEYIAAGGSVYLFIVCGEKAPQSTLCIYDPLQGCSPDTLIATVPYQVGGKYKGLTDIMRSIACQKSKTLSANVATDTDPLQLTLPLHNN